jgi:hypothetical protein
LAVGCFSGKRVRTKRRFLNRVAFFVGKRTDVPLKTLSRFERRNLAESGAFTERPRKRKRSMTDQSMANGNHSNHSSGTARPDLGAAVSEIKSAVAGKAEELAGRSALAGADAVAGVAKTAATLADSLKDQSPAVADYVRSTGQRIDRLADDLRDKSAGELLTLATDFGKRQPLALLAGSAIIGFALARIVKTGLDAPASDKTDHASDTRPYQGAAS